MTNPPPGAASSRDFRVGIFIINVNVCANAYDNEYTNWHTARSDVSR